MSWTHCAGCGHLLYRRRLTRDLEVCSECAHHHRLTAAERVAQLTDPHSFRPVPVPAGPDDPLGFTDSRPYPERLAAARAATGTDDAVLTGTAAVGGVECVLVVLDFAFLGGSMGVAVGEAVVTAADLARARSLPLVLVTASGGARMQEGVLSLMQMARTAQAVARLREAGLLTVCLLTDPTFGGVTASFASLGDVLIAESGARVGFAGPRVIRQTVREELPEGFQRAPSLLAQGLVDRVEDREQLRPVLSRLLRLHTAGAGDDLAVIQHLPQAREAVTVPDAWEVVGRARHTGRPTTRDYLASAFDDFVELHGDRAHGDDPAVVGGVAAIGGRSVVVVGHQKGHDTAELVRTNFGMPHPEGYRKALRLFRHAERLGLPVVTLIDTPGAYPGVAAEQRGQSIAIAELIAASSRLRVPLVGVVTGEGGSGGALALATGDRLLVLENAFFSVISPEGCASILWRTAEAAPQAAQALRLTAPDLLRLGIADQVVPEPGDGAHADPSAAAGLLRTAVVTALNQICPWDAESLLREREQRIGRLGQTSLLAEGATA
ncbi:acetyl-CoA carboxylase carboxyltransferase subunit alpha [Kineosporia sp. J2-2]|uniref:Multifunctional fusion protein n=1 Tax=Kineosporia corallincola TaxID=2835133 RepID=A0ABS5TEK9_9ACTN|nr:acetyl-CoA carboxylase carboxyltransferase subunit alpha [Kineosporia corallincola]MBT0769502.1 acetyl-CoA carboxylase carboxyltransferase subunit alpha [Kineosporia corallincola]